MSNISFSLFHEKNITKIVSNRERERDMLLSKMNYWSFI